MRPTPEGWPMEGVARNSQPSDPAPMAGRRLKGSVGPDLAGAKAVASVVEADAPTAQVELGTFPAPPA